MVESREIALSAVWHAQAFTGPLRTVDGQDLHVVFRGTWTHGFGPDFQDALIRFPHHELRSGSVEVHLKTGAWRAHRHDSDPRYDNVILHVVHTHDGAETRRHDGGLVPVVEVGSLLRTPLSDGHDVDASQWSRFGGETCAPGLSHADPTEVRAILHRLGDVRLASRSAGFEADLSLLAPAQVLYARIWDGLGYHQNREPMRRVAETISLADFEALLEAAAPERRLTVARGLMLGVAGFLPLSPTDAMLARVPPEMIADIEAAWQRFGGAWHQDTLAPTDWTRARVRPANHPAARLIAGANLLANVAARGGLVAALLGPIRARGPAVHDQPGAVPDLGDHLRSLTRTDDHPGLGLDRAVAIVANALLPFALALAEQTDDYALLDAAAMAWERLPAADTNAVTRRALAQVAGTARIQALGARGQQGLIQLDQTLCAPRRCFECPIAHRVLADA